MNHRNKSLLKLQWQLRTLAFQPLNRNSRFILGIYDLFHLNGRKIKLGRHHKLQGLAPNWVLKKTNMVSIGHPSKQPMLQVAVRSLSGRVTQQAVHT